MVTKSKDELMEFEAFKKGSEKAMSLLDSLSKESDRGLALLATAYIDKAMEELLVAFFLNDKKICKSIFEGYSPLATFSSKIDISFLCGLIPVKAKQDLHLIRKIRNEFAHYPSEITFESAKIDKLCNQLYYDIFIGKISLRRKFQRCVLSILGMINAETFSSKHRAKRADIDLEADEFKELHRAMIETINDAFEKGE